MSTEHGEVQSSVRAREFSDLIGLNQGTQIANEVTYQSGENNSVPL